MDVRRFWPLLLVLVILKTEQIHAQCNSPLGFESGNITDQQFTASSTYRNDRPDQARINVGSGWTAGSSNKYEYLKVDLSSLYDITGYAIQGISRWRYTETFTLYYSQDNIVWTKYVTQQGESTLQGTYRETIRTFNLTPSIRARSVVFQPIKGQGYSSLRLELYGCPVKEQVPLSNTLVTRHIMDKQEWLPSLSPYVINTMTTILSSGHLKIQPGVTVVFNSSEAGLIVYGTLEATGLSGLPVRFTSSWPEPDQLPRWEGIEVKPEGNLTLEQCIVGDAREGVRGPLGAMTISHCQIHQCKTGIILSKGDTSEDRVQLSFTRITDNIEEGIYTANWNPNENFMNLKNVDVMNNRKDGFKFSGEAVITAENSRFSENGRNGIVCDPSRLKIRLQNCSFVSNYDSGFYLDGDYQTTWLEFIAVQSKFSRNKERGLYIDTNKEFVLLLNVTFIEFSKNGWDDFQMDCSYLNNGSFVNIFNNSFSRDDKSNSLLSIKVYRNRGSANIYIGKNSFFGGQALSLQGTHGDVNVTNNSFQHHFGKHAVYVNSKVHVVRNKFVNCTSASVIEIQHPEVIISENVFDNPETKYDVLTSVPFSDKIEIDASLNYWGSSDKWFVRSRVYDFYADMFKALVSVDPFYTSEDLTDLSQGSSSQAFVSDAGVIGGTIQESLSLKPDSVLHAQRSIFIPEGLELTIPRNVSLQFSHKQGISVRGTLTVNGTADGRVYFKRDDSETKNWGGIFFNSTGSSLDQVSITEATTCIRIETHTDGPLMFSDVALDKCYTGINFNIHAEAVVSLHQVNLTDSWLPIKVEYVKTGTATIKVSQSVFNCKLETSRNGPAIGTDDFSFIVSQQSHVNKWAYRKYRDGSPISVVLQTSRFEDCGIRMQGYVGNVSVVDNVFNGAKQNIKLQIQGKEQTSTEFRQNCIRGGYFTVSKKNNLDSIQIIGNTFNGSKLTLQTPNVNVKENSFLPGADFDIKFDSEKFSVVEVNCSLNFWGTTDRKDIQRRIYDKFYNDKLPHISFTPFFEYPNMTSLQYPVESFLGTDGTIGGGVDGNVTLTSAGSPYTVTNNIFVGPKDTLILAAGVSLLFPKAMGITVEGVFKVQGTPDRPVIARPLVYGEKWAGVTLYGQIYKSEQMDIEQIRLVDGKDEREGRVELMRNNTWVTVCDDGFDKADAAVVCRMLGYEPTATNDVFCCAKFGEGSGDILGVALQCLGFESQVADCPWKAARCSQREAVSVRCSGVDLPEIGDVDNEVDMRNFILNDTSNGLQIAGNVKVVENVTSTYSSDQPAVRVDVGLRGIDLLHIKGLTASHSGAGLKIVRLGYDVQKQKNPEIYLSDCHLHSHKWNGIEIEATSKVTVRRCQITKNKYRALYIKTGTVLDISETLFSQNDRGVLDLQYRNFKNQLSISIQESRILHCGKHFWSTSIFDFDMSSVIAFSFMFENNFVSENYRDLITYSLRGSGGNAVIFVHNNTIINHRGQIAQIGQYSAATFQFQFSKNTFENSSVSKEAELSFDIYRNSKPSQIDVSQNVFTNNNARYMIHFENSNELNEKVHVTKNVFRNNQGSATVSTAAFDVELHDNVFRNPQMTCELEVPGFRRWLEIDAQFNYWGIPDTQAVSSRICGFDTNMDKGFVRYLPFYVSEDRQETSSDMDTDFFSPNLFGGEVNKEVTIKKSSTVYEVRRSIYIRNNGTLRIESGAKMVFHPGRGIYADGLLLAEGESERITMGPSSAELWYGIVLPHKTAVMSDTLRLVNGSNPGEGRVEIFHEGEWSTVCSITDRDALLLCEALGYRFAKHREAGLFGQGNGSVVTDIGCHNAAYTLEDCNPVNDHDGVCGHSSDVGLICQHLTAIRGPRITMLSHVDITSSENGLHIQTPNVRLSRCNISHTLNAGIKIETRHLDLDLNGTVVEHGLTDGMLIKVPVPEKLRIYNGTFQHNPGNGIRVRAFFDESEFVRFEDREITRIETILVIESNVFINNTKSSMDIRAIAETDDQRNVLIANNYLKSSGPVLIFVPRGSTNFKDNRAVNCTGHNGCFLKVQTVTESSANLSISSNYLEGTSGECVVHLTSQKSESQNTFQFNQLYFSKSMEAVILLDAKEFLFSENRFDNPSAVYELKVVKEGDSVINAKHNWWGTANQDKAGAKILHKEQNSVLVRVDFIPILTKQDFDCSAVNNCSQKGECVRPNGCRCNLGWSGPECNDFDCSGLKNCHGNGKCVGPNQCQCNEGWKGQSCELATCNRVDDCGGDQRGYCVRPDQCTCFPQFSGPDCSQCASHRWGIDCLPCPKCIHGSCNQTTGLCDCSTPNWSGALCDSCSTAYYGPLCLPYITVLTVIPSSGPDTGGTEVHVSGHNFPETSNDTYYCRFDREVVMGSRLSKEHVKCPSPRHPKGDIFLEVSHDGQQFTNNKTRFTYYEVCPPGGCGKTMSPPQGQCLYGGCVCIMPWAGNTCEVELKAPALVQPQNVEITEGAQYAWQPKLTQGSPPIAWQLFGVTEGISIDERSGEISWERAVASPIPYTLKVRASNRVGSSEVEWTVTVKLSYTVRVDELTPSGVLPVPRSVLIRGYVTFLNGSVSFEGAPVDVRIRNKGKITTLKVEADSENIIQAEHTPTAGESGLFEVGASHPSQGEFIAQKSWRVLGMACVPSYVNKQAYLDTDTVELRDAFVLKNEGVDPLTNITAYIEGVGGSLSSVLLRINNTVSNDGPLVPLLQKNSELSVDVIVTASEPLSGTLALIFSADQGTRARAWIKLKLKKRRPVLIVSPRSLTDSLPRASQKSYQLNIVNEGEVSASSLRVSLPVEQRLALTAFSTERQQVDDVGLNLEPGETAIMILTVTAGPEDELGEFSGHVALNSDLASASIAYRFFVTSLDKINMTVRVEDEYTYFASDKPLVAGAVVTIRNPRRGLKEVRVTTNATEFVLFEDIPEDRYTLTVESPNHGSYSAVVIAKPSKSAFTVFLQRTAVRYSWTVTPTTVQDKYIITLDSTFETQVPMPVVTVDPSKVNTIPFEDGIKDVVNFKLTNHGFIRANDVRFVLPKNHPTLIFTQTIDPIGDIDANTTVVVPVLIRAKPRVKRSGGSRPCSMSVLYSYVCGVVRTAGAVVGLTQEYPGAPPPRCGRLRGSGGGRGGVLPHGSAVGYTSITPLSCDCLENLLKSCVLGFHPVYGCVLAIQGLPGSKGFWGRTKAVLDYAFACILSTLSPVCPTCGAAANVWTAIWCVYEADRNCLSKRRRRAINSEVNQALIASNEPMRNYLIMLKELFGSEEVFDLYDGSWASSFNLALADDSTAGGFLSESEMTSITDALNTTQRDIVDKFLHRWNRTMAAWKNGSLASLDSKHVISYDTIMSRFETFVRDTAVTKQRGHESIFDAYDHSVNVYEKAQKKSEKEEGICARVRVRIVQELVLTREAFNARLELENGELSALENIKVEIIIKATYGNGTSAINLFSIGSPELVGVTGVDGTGSLKQGISGTAEWLIIPYSTAAVREDTLYDVGGTLSYTVGGSDLSVSLLPDTITVTPNPSLVVNYFHEKYVQGDDPMTKNIVEPVVPFSLAVMVSNGAYGIARQVQITSAQPEIIENEKGLLVSFRIIGAQLDTRPVAPSLSINFGDIESFESKTARWLLTSSLRGRFYNFSATFENINPLGDPQLSLIEKIDYHELIHLVRIEENDDGRDDFLVNDMVDEEAMPETLYDSSDGLYSTAVVTADNLNFIQDRTETVGARKYIYIDLTVTYSEMVPGMFGYVRIVNNLTRNIESESLLQATREDGKEILVGRNVWQTNYYHDKFYLHIFDQYNSSIIPITYSIAFGPKNLHHPLFSSDAFEVTLTQVGAGDHVTTVIAKDRDANTELRYSLEESTLFSIDTTSGEITATAPLQSGVYELFVSVSDDGVPALSSTARVTVTVANGTIQTSTSPNLESTPMTDITEPGSTSTTPDKASTSPNLESTPMTNITVLGSTDSTPDTSATTEGGVNGSATVSENLALISFIAVIFCVFNSLNALVV